jgi:hypothetical protein
MTIDALAEEAAALRLALATGVMTLGRHRLGRCVDR